TQAVLQCGEKVSPVVGYDDRRTGGAGDLCDVGVVNATARDAVVRRRLEERTPVRRRDVVDAHPPEHFRFQKVNRLGGRHAELRRKPGGDGEEFEAAVPGGGGAGDLTFGHRVQQGLRRRALRTEVHETREQDARVEERPYGHRLRSSSTSAAMST